MSSQVWLRIAAGLTVFQALVHAFVTVERGPAKVSVREVMNNLRVSEMEMGRSYWDFYFGSGWTITALLVGMAALMWSLAPIVRSRPEAARPTVLVLTLSFAAMTAVSARDSITAPVAVAALTAVALGAAWIRARAV